MNGEAEIEAEREVLKRILALLFSFAYLAERAARRSYPIRCLVLWALRRAEAVARDCIGDGGAEDLHWNTPIAVLQRNSQAEALHLAQRFRALAKALKREIRLEEQFARSFMRGKTNRAPADTPQGCLITPDTLGRLVRTMRAVMRCLDGHSIEAMPRLDTS